MAERSDPAQIRHQFAINQNIHNVSSDNGSRNFVGLHQHFGSERSLHEILPHADQAPFDASSRQDDPLCLEGTRTEVLKQIRAWVYGQERSCIFWLSGMAGTGKSTIARTLAQELDRRECLGASFFFVRGGGDASHAGKFFTSIACQLAVRLPDTQKHILQTVQQMPDIASKSRTEQWKQLIVQSLEKTYASTIERPIVVLVIDALDECDNDNDMRGIVAVLAQSANVAGVTLRVILTSRPDTPIRLGFQKMSEILHRDLLLHEVPQEIVDADLCLYFYDQLEQIKEMYGLSEEWPGIDCMNQLVRVSAGLFIFAATACRFLQECDMSVEEALNLFLDSSVTDDRPSIPSDAPGRRESTLFLDRMYSQILARSHTLTEPKLVTEHAPSPVKEMLGALAALGEPLPVAALASLLCLRESDVRQRLNRLHSVVYISRVTNVPVRFFHTSLRDFLFDACRSSDSGFTINRREMHANLLKHCLKAMESTLRRNICNLATTGTLATDVDRIVVDAYIPTHVQYACQFWVHHLRESQTNSATVEMFLQTHFPHWVEAMSLMGRISEAVHMIAVLQETAEGSQSFADFLHDAKRLILFSGRGIEEAPLQMYESTLLFAPKSSAVRQQFAKQMPGWISRVGQEEEDWDACLQILAGHSSNVTAVAFSPDGKMLASASRDKTVRVWDTTSGRSMHELVGHSHYVNAVAFSPDGKTLASASDDTMVRVWDTTSGRSVHELVSHFNAVTAVSFSPDGKTLASASDKTVQVWDTTSGRNMHELVGHSDIVTAVAFSPNGKMLASASADMTVRLWETISGRSVHELVGHFDAVAAVAFSPEGKTLASASDDTTVRVWDTTSGRSMHELVGHFNAVTAVSFSPDGKTLASASWDKMVQLWDTMSRRSMHKLVGHYERVTAVAFSPDGKTLASASADTTVRLWETTSRRSVHELVGHSGEVTAVAFSLDGKTLASVSWDKTVRVWDTTSRRSMHELVGHSDIVSAVAFSPDGKMLASASWDKTVRVWDTTSGRSMHKLVGHFGEVTAIAFSLDSKMLASASFDKTVRLWDTTSGRSMHELVGHSYHVNAVAFSPDGKTLASASAADTTVRVWDTTSGRSVHELVGHFDVVAAVAFSPDGKTLASASDDKTVRLWDTTSGHLSSTYELQEVPRTLSFSPNRSSVQTDNGFIIISDRISNNTTQPLPRVRSANVKDGWLYLDGVRTLWIPYQYQVTCSAVCRNVLAVGCQSGQVLLFLLAEQN